MKKTIFLGLSLLLTLMGSGVAEGDTQTVIEGRVVNLFLPTSSSISSPKGLVILLHSYGGTGKQIDGYLQFKNIAKDASLIYVTVEGTKDGSGKQFWNATPSCCNFAKKQIDEADFFKKLITEIEKQNAIDPLRIFIVGHSNGGFMAHSLACSLSPTIAGIISIAGEQFMNPSDCQPNSVVNILQIQGLADQIVPYSGGNLGLAPFPSAEETVKIWATKNRCDLSKLTTKEVPSLVSGIPQVSSLTKRYEGCPIGGSVELWVIPGAGHIPNFNARARSQIILWLQTHPKIDPNILKFKIGKNFD